MSSKQEELKEENEIEEKIGCMDYYTYLKTKGFVIMCEKENSYSIPYMHSVLFNKESTNDWIVKADQFKLYREEHDIEEEDLKTVLRLIAMLAKKAENRKWSNPRKSLAEPCSFCDWTVTGTQMDWLNNDEETERDTICPICPIFCSCLIMSNYPETESEAQLD